MKRGTIIIILTFVVLIIAISAGLSSALLYKGAKGQSCNQVCSSKNLTCVQEDWNDDNCEFCKSFYPNSTCSSLSNDYGPAYNTVYSKCVKRSSTIPQNCSRTAGAYERICLCEGQTTPPIIEPPEEPEETTQSPSCIDSDRPNNLAFYNSDKFTAGNVTASGLVYRDICYSSAQLKESYCLSNKTQAYSPPLLCGSGFSCITSSNGDAYCANTTQTQHEETQQEDTTQQEETTDTIQQDKDTSQLTKRTAATCAGLTREQCSQFDNCQVKQVTTTITSSGGFLARLIQRLTQQRTTTYICEDSSCIPFNRISPQKSRDLLIDYPVVGTQNPVTIYYNHGADGRGSLTITGNNPDGISEIKDYGACKYIVFQHKEQLQLSPSQQLYVNLTRSQQVTDISPTQKLCTYTSYIIPGCTYPQERRFEEPFKENCADFLPDTSQTECGMISGNNPPYVVYWKKISSSSNINYACPLEIKNKPFALCVDPDTPIDEQPEDGTGGETGGTGGGTGGEDGSNDDPTTLPTYQYGIMYAKDPCGKVILSLDKLSQHAVPRMLSMSDEEIEERAELWGNLCPSVNLVENCEDACSNPEPQPEIPPEQPDENQIRCFLGYGENPDAEWYCDKVINYIPQRCGGAVGLCEQLEYTDYSDPIIRWLDLSEPTPPECQPEDSILVMFSSEPRQNFINYQLSNYYRAKEVFGDCTFAVRVESFDDVDKIAYDQETGIRHSRDFKHLLVHEHGSLHGTCTDTGGSYGSLISEEGIAEMMSCSIGTRRFFGLFGIPRTVENFCTIAIQGTKITSSKTIVSFGLDADENNNFQYLTFGDYECWECTNQNPPRAKKLSLNECPTIVPLQ